MNILAIQWSICSSAALYAGGSIRAAANEERFTRTKNDDSFPVRSIRYCLEAAGVKASDLDGVAICSVAGPYQNLLLRQATWSVEDYLKEQHEYWYPRLYKGESPSRTEVLAHKIDLDAFPPAYWKAGFGAPKAEEKFFEDRETIAADFLAVPRSIVKRIDHHRSHAAYAYYGSPFRNQDVLALTVDGWGDWQNATIGRFDSDGAYERLFGTLDCNIGRIYRYMTLLLGMKPNEHEYKLMGLAPYGREAHARRALEVFRGTMYVDGIEFKWKQKPTDSYFWFKERLEGVRFDNIAWALQTWVEELLTDWTRNAVRKFGIGRIVYSGGVAMNIKAMGRIAALPEVESLFVPGSASDESLAIGSAFCLAEDLSRSHPGGWDSASVPPLAHLYFGPSASPAQEQDAVQSLESDRFEVHSKPSNAQIARLLAGGKVIARCVGRMEFGQRALGNRSILADPTIPMVRDKINAMIKSRDFWMPFAPVVLDSYAPRYLVNPKDIESPHMTIAFETTAEGFDAMPAACHPADHTARAQILHRTANPELYELLVEFSRQTGRGALLNTSFNLHGHPIVNTPQDAVHVLRNSGLDGLLLADALVLKRADAPARKRHAEASTTASA